MYKGQAKYHNGKNAAVHDVELSFDIETGELTFQHLGETILWAPFTYSFEKRGKTLLLFNKKEYANFEITDPDFAVPFLQRFDGIAQASFYTRLIRAGFAAHIGLAVVTLFVVYFMSQHAIPFVAEKSVYLIPPSLDDKLGETYFNEFIYYSDIDHERTKLVQTFADSMELQSKKEIKITVVNDYTVNAFALPSGHVVIFSGILDKMERYEELAALLTHEVSHVNKRHSMRALLRNLSGRLFLSAIVGDVSRFTDILISNADRLTGLSYSRELETEADEEGMKLMKQNKINSVGFQLLFESLSEESHGVEPPEFLNTHPVTKNRISAAKKNQFKGVEHPDLESLFESMFEYEESTEVDVIEFPDVEASYPGGPKEMMKFLQSNIIYPPEAIANEDQGKVYLNFIVEKDGSITNIEVQRGVSLELDREAKRVLRKMPKWIPGQSNGRKIRARCRIPIVFTLN